MSIRTSISNSGYYSNKKQKPFGSDEITGTVVYVYLDDSESPTLKLPSSLTSLVHDKEMLIGHCKIALSTDSVYNIENLPSYPPANPDEGLPLVGEKVQMVTIGGKLCYRRIPSTDINKGNATEDALLFGFPTEDSSNNSAGYSQSNKTGIPTKSGGGDRKAKIGEYFEAQQINPLNLYEGDRIIQSRFGQSIRFSGYNNTDNKFAPVIVIRNRQSDKSLSETKEFQGIDEDWIEDGSTIAITSNDYKIDFTPGTEDTKFDTNPVYTEEPELKGTDQILINSGRIILSSKNAEMMFYSKGNYSFVSDGKLTIDNGNDGASIDLNGEYRTTTNDNNMYFLGGSGEIYLNTESDKEPLVRGEALKELLEELIDAINSQIFSTPSGPTLEGPNNRATFNKIKSKLDKMLSTLNYTE